jgi:catechol 2,3-dioxygenase-like lactoylglutathione lyase family enzyme
MISHAYVGVGDFARAFHFYSAVLGELGAVLKFHDPHKPLAAWMAPDHPRPLFVIAQPFDGQAHSVGNGQMTALLAPSRAAVLRAYETAIAHGAQCEGAPGLRPHYHQHYYGAYIRDLDGNKLGVCCHHPE